MTQNIKKIFNEQGFVKIKGVLEKMEDWCILNIDVNTIKVINKASDIY